LIHGTKWFSKDCISSSNRV